jgi:hypothetical protein
MCDAYTVRRWVFSPQANCVLESGVGTAAKSPAGATVKVRWAGGYLSTAAVTAALLAGVGLPNATLTLEINTMTDDTIARRTLWRRVPTRPCCVR